eukprot:CAMPEP_0198212048 /NCGR_PEP_ID=MMETSP1445-20131203/25492_1 /TAXON_ID=36898 /ORGANISM="Pyramimonas sp., Strain CCMP2087" /LENGTH=148 /DNA_ID=CAMNT_0043886421 /DNA_START=165 /DNA_END=608 /DNA_ORIENTATION=+
MLERSGMGGDDLHQKVDTLASRGLRDLHRLVSSANNMLAGVQNVTNAVVDGSFKTSEDAEHSTKTTISAEQAGYAQARETLQRVLTECANLEGELERRRAAPPEGNTPQRERLLSEVQQMRKEATRKNGVIKGLINELRALLSDLSVW